jgi:glycosyltransferase involved in cell wall biosynthesis
MPTKMRIGYFTNQYPAPSHTFIRREIGALERRGHDILRYAIRPAAVPLVDPDDQKEEGKTRHILRQPRLVTVISMLRAILRNPPAAGKALVAAMRFAAHGQHSYGRHLLYLVEALVLASWCRRDAIDHLHVHFGTNPATVACLARIMMDASLSITVHGPEEFDRPERLALQDKIRCADFVAAVSSFGRSQLLRWAQLDDWKKIHVVPCGIDKSYVQATSLHEDSGSRLVCIGRLSEQKGHLLLLDAVAQLRRRGTDLKLVLIGDGPMRPHVADRIQQLQLGPVVELLGTVDQQRIRQELVRARGLVLPSFAEGLPVVLMESMALARPVVATFIAGIPELVTPETGYLVPAGDVGALAQAMENLLSLDGKALQALGAAARMRVAARHDIDEAAALLDDLIARAVRGKATAATSGPATAPEPANAQGVVEEVV